MQTPHFSSSLPRFPFLPPMRPFSAATPKTDHEGYSLQAMVKVGFPASRRPLAAPKQEYAERRHPQCHRNCPQSHDRLPRPLGADPSWHQVRWAESAGSEKLTHRIPSQIIRNWPWMS